MAVYQCYPLVVTCRPPQMHFTWLLMIAEQMLVVDHGGAVTACSVWPPEAAGAAACLGHGLEKERLLDVQHTYAEEDRSNGCSGGNIILHKHALLYRQHAVVSNGHPSLLVQLLPFKREMLFLLAS